MKLIDIAKNFKIEGEYVKGERYGSGHINETYAIVFSRGNGLYKRYILQKINNRIFTDVDGLMANIKGVTEFAREKVIADGGNPDIETLTLIPTTKGKPYFFDGEGGYWRVYILVEEGMGYDTITNPRHFYASGVMFGKFQKLLAKYPSEKLFDVIPDFHNTRVRFNAFTQSVKADMQKRARSVKEEIEFYLSRESYADKIVNLLDSGKMPLRVTHNDTKLNNVLISQLTDEGICVIDLDTIMKGSVLYDFGDSIRFGANHCSEDEKDLSKVNFDIELFKTYAQGFLSEVGEVLTECEIENLAFGAILMTYECGMRFLTDYLNGDKYFRTSRENQNLDRTRTQIKLVKDMEKNLTEMNGIVKKLIKR